MITFQKFLKEAKKEKAGLYYKLLYIGSASKDLTNKILKNNEKWNEFYKTIN